MTSPIEPQDPGDDDGRMRSRSLLLRGRWLIASLAVAAGLVIGGSVYVLSTSSQGPSGANVTDHQHAAVIEPGAEHPSGASATSSARVPGQGPQNPTKARYRGRVVEVVNNGKINVCALISGHQVNQVMGERLRTPVPVVVGTFDECATSPRHAGSSAAAGVRVAWAVPPEPDPALPFRQLTINLPRSDAVQGLGQKAYCSSQGSASELFVLDGHHFLETFADTCAHAMALTRIELGRL